MVQRPLLASVQAMTPDEARACVNAIRRNMDEARRLLLELYEREGWRALGYASWRECVIAEFGESRATLYRQLEAAQLQRDISQLEKNIPYVQLKPLAALETPEERREAWREAVETAPDGKLTAAHVEAVVERRIEQERVPHVAHNSGENEWYTPSAIIEAARAVLGVIDLDPASHPDAQEVVRAVRFYTREDDGLRQYWQGRVFLNPPYSQPLIAQFCAKLTESFFSGTVPEAITLTNNGTETEWGQRLLRAATAICFPDGRVKFWAPGRESAPLQGQMLCYLGVEPQRFREHFAPFGTVLVVQPC